MNDIISYDRVFEHGQYTQRLRALRPAVLEAFRDAPEALASPLLTGTVGALLGDIYRLVSREPGARLLPRPDPARPPRHRQLNSMLRDAQLALDTFAWRHRDHEHEYGDEWITLEGIAYREENLGKLSPPDDDDL
ncbi:MAG TPA: hypothetical protein VIL88_00845 [Devosia sp.]|jgi:hypothetical protein|uniref:hypothetical protein n=1 Tax=Devosia sp. TaxID=1871048 RepID=UPI002F926BE1